MSLPTLSDYKQTQELFEHLWPNWGPWLVRPIFKTIAILTLVVIILTLLAKISGYGQSAYRTAVDWFRPNSVLTQGADPIPADRVQPVQPSTPPTSKARASKTIAELMNVLKGRTALQAEPFIADQVGKWIDVEGKLNHMTPTGGAVQILNDQGILVQCAFEDEKSLPKLRTLRMGDHIRIGGAINRYQVDTKLALIDCELGG
jgi:hypothetical protein